MTSQIDTDPRWWQHASLTEPRSLIGAGAVLLGVILLLVVPPFVDDRTGYAEVSEEGRIAVDEYYSFEIAGGWEITQRDELLLILAKGGGQVLTSASVDDDASLPIEEYAQALADGLASTPDVSWRVTPVQPFTTDSGAEGATYVGHSTDQATAVWVVGDNGRQATFSAVFPETSFDTLFADTEAMALSIEISATPEGGGG